MTQLKLRSLVIVAAAALAIATPSLSYAQELVLPNQVQGYYLGLNLQGSMHIYRNPDDQWSTPWFGGGGSLRAGQNIFRWLDIGIAGGATVVATDDWYALIGRLQLEAQLRPTESLFARIGVGAGGIDFTRTKKNKKKIIGQFGGAYSIGIGYDFFPSDQHGSGGLAITPIVGVDFLPGNEIVSISTWIGVEITWWSGLPKNRLILPETEVYN
jgi:hypothetical protein